MNRDGLHNLLRKRSSEIAERLIRNLSPSVQFRGVERRPVRKGSSESISASLVHERDPSEREEDGEARRGVEVVDDALVALRRALAVDQIAKVHPEVEPLGEVELHADAARVADALAGSVDGAGAERHVKVEASDRAAEPAHLAVRERPDQVPMKSCTSLDGSRVIAI